MKRLIAIFFIACRLAPAVSASRDELSSVQAKIADAKSEDAAISDRIKDNEKIVMRTKRELVKAADALSKLEDQTATVGDRIKALEKQHDALRARILENDRNLAAAAAGLLEVGAAGAPFDDNNAGDYVLRMALLSGISEQFDADMQIAAGQIRQLNRTQTELEKQHGIFEAAQLKRKKEQGELDKLLRARAAHHQELKSRQYDLQKKLTDLSSRAKNLTELAEHLSPNDDYDAPPDNALPPPASGGKMRFPASGMLLLRFGERGASGLKSDGWRVRTRPNALVVAPADGRIEFADHFRGYNRIAIINHNNGYYSVLTGMGALNVLIGQDVLAGEPIGRMPESNPEIYLELRTGANAVNPSRMFAEPR